MRVRREGNALKDTYLTTFSGVGDSARVSFFRNSIHNLLVAVEARVFRRKVGDEWKYVDETPHENGIYFRPSKFVTEFKKHVDPVAPMTEQEFVEHYKGRRRRVYEKAHESLQEEPVTKQDAECKCFLKKEKDISSDKPDAIPRVITFPDPRFGMSIGMFVKPIEEGFFDCIDQVFGSKTVMKGLNYLQVGKEIENKWNRFANPRSMDGDVSRLDSCISNEAQRLYHELALEFYSGDERSIFKQLCEMQLDVKVKGRAGDGSLSYQSSGLGSGQMNTSQMGVLIVCYILFELIQFHNLDLEVVNCGDDFTVIGESRTVKTFAKVSKQFFAKYNLTLKLERENDIIEGINFCQTNPVKVDGVYRMVRVPRTAAIKDSSSIDNLVSTSQKCRFLHAISCAGIATHGGIPIFQEVYKMYARNSSAMRSKLTSKRSIKKSYRTNIADHSMLYWGKGLSCSYKSITPETRFSFYLAFDIDPKAQKDLEKYYRQHYISDLITRDEIGDERLW